MIGGVNFPALVSSESISGNLILLDSVRNIVE